MRTEICFDCYRLMQKREEIANNRCQIFWICESCGKRKYDHLDQVETSQKTTHPKSRLIYLVCPTVFVKYCHDCLTPINRYSKEEYCLTCKRDRIAKENSDTATPQIILNFCLFYNITSLHSHFFCLVNLGNFSLWHTSQYS